MKNVKTLLIFITISTFVFASSTRTEALGGAGFWADDYANVGAFPADINNHNVAWTNGSNFTSIFDHNGTTWGFTGGTGDDVANIMWGNGEIGATLGLSMTPAQDAVGATAAVEASNDFAIGVGMPLAGGDFGFSYDGDNVGVNHRRAQDVWVWDNMLINFNMALDDTDTDADESGMAFAANLYKNQTYDGGTSSLFALGLTYSKVGDADAATGIEWNFAVESAMTDWATLRVGYSHGYDFSSGGSDVSDDVATADVDEQVNGFTMGLGFNYGSFTLDMAVGSTALFNDPMPYIVGQNSTALGAGWTISYNW
jgi:hypothetical protein